RDINHFPRHPRGGDTRLYVPCHGNCRVAGRSTARGLRGVGVRTADRGVLRSVERVSDRPPLRHETEGDVRGIAPGNRSLARRQLASRPSKGLTEGLLPKGLGRSYLFLVRGLWKRLPASLRPLPLGQFYGRHLHTLVRLHAARSQSFGTFFLRNRPELELMRGLADRQRHGARMSIAVLACSKGVEV